MIHCLRQTMALSASLLVLAGLACGRAVADPSPTPSASAMPSPAPSPSPSPSPAVTLHGVLSGTLVMTSGVNATGSFDSPSGMDSPSRVNVSNAFVLLAKTQGVMQFALQGGAF